MVLLLVLSAVWIATALIVVALCVQAAHADRDDAVSLRPAESSLGSFARPLV